MVNSGSTVEECRFEVVGPCAEWTTAEPESLSLYPGSSGDAVLKLRPPRSPEIEPGRMPLGLRVVPTSDPGGVVIPESSVTVLPFTEVTADLVPRTSSGSWRGRHKVAVDSLGNIPTTVQLVAQAASERVRLEFVDPETVVAPGEAKFVPLRVRSTQRIWRGVPATHPFQVTVTPAVPEDGAPHQPVLLDGSYEQTPVLPAWLPRALFAAVLVAALLTGLWFTVLRPGVESAAREAVTPEAIREAVNDTVKPTDGGASGGPSGATGTEETQGSGGTNAGESDKPEPGEPGGPAASKSARVKVEDSVGGGATKVTALEVPPNSTFALTDIVVQNPQGDAGSLVVTSEGGELLNLSMENFRASDYHFVTPIQVTGNDAVTVVVECRKVGRPVGRSTPGKCAESVFLGGTMKAAAEE
ncbi:hypothetical protein N566_15350 [Streptomycetaceae bacterium MP113-05]|nr:hypothetical protein N566_15350 [Streptomycetaceae bacterium MP113-05]